MAWDIYGNNLKAGYCEVHYWVPEEYPCYLCMRDIEQENKRRDDRDLVEQAYQEHMEAIEREYQEECELEIVSSKFSMINKFLSVN